ncbi:DUF5357 family protein [[Phormidium] sp. ETS-05]|uniref:DUF5357 family protein n=1 Tax=[Phormidium] sp. ETS-05 TaxID=222819 RepID=UPI0018EF18FD|nr:DUF5357 family protein [[Phormidium] sp. ETS-05]
MKSNSLMNRLAQSFKPPRPFSWETIILLSLFSWLMVLLTGDWGLKAAASHQIITGFAIIFSLIGVTWAQIQHPWKLWELEIWPGIAALILCILIFGYWEDNWLYLTGITWPILWGTLVSVADFFKDKKSGLSLAEIRQRIIILMLVSCLASTWVQFAFLIDYWTEQYPTIIAKDLSQSTFVVRVNRATPPDNRGAVILEAMVKFLQSQVEGKRWQEVNAWIKKLTPGELESSVKLRLPQYGENQWWEFKVAGVQTEAGYKLELFVFWTGPQTKSTLYHFRKVCEIRQIYYQQGGERGGIPANIGPFVTLECQPGSERLPGQPKSIYNWLDDSKFN